MGNWWSGDPEHGIIGDDHEVSFKVGSGDREGHTLISDGFLDKDEFQAHHDHYGPNTDYPGGGRVEDIRPYTGSYTGPGC